MLQSSINIDSLRERHGPFNEIENNDHPQKRCDCCHGVVVQAPGRGRKRRFCSDACKNHWNYKGPMPHASPWPITDEPILHHGPFQQFQSSYQNQFDLIITDPPYDRRSLPIYKDLADFCMVTLKVGGWALVLTGNGISYEAETYLREEGMEFLTRTVYWMEDAGPQCRKWTSTGPRIWQQGYKPILWFQKPAPLAAKRTKHPAHRRGGTRDYVRSGDPGAPNRNHDDLDGHKWQQSFPAFVDIVNTYTNAQDTICDPCCGSGTTLLAALARGRERVIGIEVDAQALAKTRHRLAEQRAQRRG